MGEPTIPGTNGWPDSPVGRALLAVNAVKTMDGRAALSLDSGDSDEAASYIRLVLTACGEHGVEPKHVLRFSAMTSDNMVRGQMARAIEQNVPADVNGLAHAVWLDGFLHGIATARRLWADEETGVVELRPEESDDAR